MIASCRNHIALLSIIGALLLSACDPQTPTKVIITNPLCDTQTEAPICTTNAVFNDPVTITGKAVYNRREIFLTNGGGLGSAAVDVGVNRATQNPIRRAEVQVLDSSGSVVQCANTDDSGVFSFTLPRGTTLYTVRVNSRGYNNYLRASVLNNPNANAYYSLIKNNVPATDDLDFSVSGPMIAAADGQILGGAFNILDQIYSANKYLVSKVNNCDSTFTGCRNVTTDNPIPKVSAYWTKGLNPNSYLGGTSGLSFYLPGCSRMFILGGEDGDTNSSDTDHFDNPVIIHEYGHFLEDTVGVSDSPGGPHNGNAIIDPRLAWSEGWGNFFQAAVLGQARYVDTIGNSDGQTGLAFYVDTETVNASNGYDFPTAAGEGNFREFAVTRMLWDAVDTAEDSYFGFTDNVVSNDFANIWAAFTSTTRGFKYSGHAFRNVGLLHLIQQKYNVSDWSTIRGLNRQDGNQSQYAQYVSTDGCNTGAYAGYHYQITPATITGDDGSLARSDLFRNNDFFFLRAASSGSHTIKLVYQQQGQGQEPDLNLYVYREDYIFGRSDSLAGRGGNTLPAGTATETETVSVNMTAGAAYLINVNVNTANGPGVQAYYKILFDGSPLCPSTALPP